MENEERMIKIRTRFQQIVPPQAHVEFSVDPYNLFLGRPAREGTTKTTKLVLREQVDYKWLPAPAARNPHRMLFT